MTRGKAKETSPEKPIPEESKSKRYEWCQKNINQINLSTCMTCPEYYGKFKAGKPVCDLYEKRKESSKPR